MRKELLLVASTALGLAGLVLLSIAVSGPEGRDRAELIASNNVRSKQARAMVGETSTLQQQQKAQAMDSLEEGLKKGMHQNVFKSHQGSPMLCEGRGCTYDSAPIVPEQVAFECGGMQEATSCLSSVQTCLDDSEALIAKYYQADKRRAREARPLHVCKCFISNGCEPACNVAMYMVWSTGSRVTCPSRPPSYMDSARAFHYGNPYASDVVPTDVSYDYFPEYPSPAGRSFTVEDMRRTYHSDDRTPHTLPPSHPWNYGQYQFPAAETYYHPYSFYSPFYSTPNRPYTYHSAPWWWYSQHDSNPYRNYYNYYSPYSYNSASDYWSNYYKGFDQAGSGADYATPYNDYDPAWEAYGDYYYDPVSGEVVMS